MILSKNETRYQEIETESESAAASACIPEFNLNVKIFLFQINIRKEWIQVWYEYL